MVSYLSSTSDIDINTKEYPGENRVQIEPTWIFYISESQLI